MLESRQLPGLDLIDDGPHASLGGHVGLDGGDAFFGSNVAEELRGRVLVANDGEDLASGSQGADDGCCANVACGSNDEDGLHGGFVGLVVGLVAMWCLFRDLLGVERAPALDGLSLYAIRIAVEN